VFIRQNVCDHVVSGDKNAVVGNMSKSSKEVYFYAYFMYIR